MKEQQQQENQPQSQNEHYRKGKFTKVADYLYRYSTTKVYYAVYRHGAKMVWKSLKTTDRELAGRLLKETLQDADHVEPRNQGMTLGELIGLYEKSLEQHDGKTKESRTSFIKKLKSTWKNGFDVLVRDITEADVELWLSDKKLWQKGKSSDSRIKKVSFNEYIRVVKHLFDLAIKSKVIANSPAESFAFLKKEDPDRATPTWEQFHALIADIRSRSVKIRGRSVTIGDPDSADLVEFMGLAGVGTAECGKILGQHVDFQKGTITLYRSKTDTGYRIPIFPQVKELLKRMADEGKIENGKKVFCVHDPKKGLAAACKRLKFPHFSSRAIRRCFITRAVENGVDFKTIASWQGHKDGGVLIARTYSHLRNEHSDSMAKKMA